MATSELFPGESGVRQQVIEAGWSETIGNGWALVFEGPENENLTLRAYPSFFLEGVTPAYLIVETLEGDPQRGPLGFTAYDEYRIEISYMKKSGLGRTEQKVLTWSKRLERYADGQKTDRLAESFKIHGKVNGLVQWAERRPGMPWWDYYEDITFATPSDRDGT